MPKKTRKQSRRHRRRRTYRRVPKKGGADTFPLLPTSKAIEVSTAPDSSDNLLAFKGK